MMEEATPMHFSSTSRLAPQELYRPAKRAPLSASEMSKTDRNRHRRQIKSLKRNQRKQQDERAKTLARFDPRKKGALEKREALKSLAKNKNVTILKKREKSK
jgi:U3 small nucleolar ribonucleoprotein component